MKLLRRLLPLFAGVLFIGIWYMIHFSLTVGQRYSLPRPDAILAAFQSEGAILWNATLNTALGAISGFLSAIVISFVSALLLALSPLIRASLYPYLMMLQMTPIIVLAPILILWTGPGFISVTVITFLICFFPLVVNTTQGLISTDRNLVDFFRMNRASRAQELCLLRVPSALPYFFTGLRIAATLAPIGAIVGDIYAGNSAGGRGGLGFQTIIYSAQFKIPALFATAFASCLLGFIFVGTVMTLHWLLLHKWHDAFNRTDT